MVQANYRVSVVVMGKGKKTKGKVSRSLSVVKPPMLAASVRTKHVFRWAATTGTSNITVLQSDLLNSLLMCFSATQFYRMSNAMRIERIEMWSWATGVTPVEVSLTWKGEYGPSVVLSDLSAGTANPAHVSARPPRMSSAAFWRSTGYDETSELFEVDCPAGTIIDVHVELVLDNASDTSTAITYTSGTGTPGISGEIFGGMLDKSAGASRTLIPSGYVNAN